MRDRRTLTLGIVLLLLGVFFLLRRTFVFPGPSLVLLLIGAGLLIVSALRNWRGPLLPAGILLGLGGGFWVADSVASRLPRWPLLLLGLAAGFLLVAVLDRVAGRRRDPSPLVPGLILLTIALVAILAYQVDLAEPLRVVGALWPWALVVAGVALLLQAFTRGRKV